MIKDEYDVIQIDEKSWRIEDKFVRAYLFAGKTKALLVDSTNGSGELQKLVRKLAGDLPIMLVNTHADSDHIGCNGQFEEAYMHPAEFAYYVEKSRIGDAVPKALEEGDTIDLGDRQFEVILTPGHTCGSIVLLDRINRILLGGDTILSQVFIFGKVRNLRAIIASLKKIRNRYWNDFDTIYTSHGDFQVDKMLLMVELECAELHLAGKIPGKDSADIPLEPPEFRPAKIFEWNGAAFFDYADE